jgi:hypothetical protein
MYINEKKINNILGQKKNKKIWHFYETELTIQHGLISSPTPKLLAGNIRALKVRRSKSSPFAVHRSKPYQLLRRAHFNLAVHPPLSVSTIILEQNNFSALHLVRRWKPGSGNGNGGRESSHSESVEPTSKQNLRHRIHLQGFSGWKLQV